MQNLDATLGYGQFILSGALATVELTIFSCVLALLMAFLAGLALLSRYFGVRVVARTYVEFFRGTSIFVQLFAAYFVLPLAGISLSPVQAGVLAIGLNGGAYGAEIVRAGVQAIARDQTEATIALNLTRWQAMQWVILPQAVVVMLPSFGNLAIEIMKSTAVASLVTVSELTFQAQMVRSQTGGTAMPYVLILVTYLVIASVLMALVRWLERRFSRGIAAVGREAR
ncbi:MAG: ectoine/hydroxyectoine ABC transporter permease subunit EhuC [Mesorhizobium sp.]|uniref:ectoine/hydroxyectoine ABC transporter permease subunit EhuC n=1 Tax=Mesorhizobium sp. TaxID=1871066 RepID=UPI000FEA0D1F|nr:ectoine/hydroxyectoine ABC transporter permease subunit EhuC [Mesorhizobium sp.]RWA88124.1 MAG: ectoine/hydroxyectoine ABC transporter permease subunit EhuC [Mesorhizobium sp.]TIU35765.1 MAG: ectoine/hydroxyectoine ABC transporter permease subunit EhuC [Mesorhizobium sp.]